MTASTIQVLLFDLGNVLIEVDFNLAFSHWQQFSPLSLAELKAAFQPDAAYQRHERGEISSAEYFSYLRSQLHLQADLDEIATGWNAIFPGEISATRQLIENVKTRFPCHMLSNTNAAHQLIWSAQFPEVVAAFDRLFISSEMGYRKPERAAFDYVSAALDVPHASILFFDDLAENVDGAIAAGLSAVQVTSPDDVRQALINLGCLV